MEPRLIVGISGASGAPLALAFVESLDQPEANGPILELLRTQTARVAQRRKEEKAHQTNLRHGGKKSGPARK